jgi:hypothetical protein
MLLALLLNVAVQEAAPVAIAADNDPAADRSLLFPAATTLPRHHWQVSLFDGVAVQGVFAFTDAVQVSLLVPLLPPFGRMYLPSVKVRLYTSPTSAVSVLAAAGFAFDTDSRWVSGAPGGAVLAGTCLGASCQFRCDALVAGAAVISNRGTDGFALAGADFSVALLGHLRLFAGAAVSVAWPEPQVGLLFPVGVRLHWQHFSADLGLALPVGLVGLGFPRVTPVGIPLANLTTGG